MSVLYFQPYRGADGAYCQHAKDDYADYQIVAKNQGYIGYIVPREINGDLVVVDWSDHRCHIDGMRKHLQHLADSRVAA